MTGTGTPGTGDVVYAYTSAYGTLTFRADGSYSTRSTTRIPAKQARTAMPSTTSPSARP
ncbi:MAG: hypothetical protein ACLSAH_02190 [Bilophila wadsworthia]